MIERAADAAGLKIKAVQGVDTRALQGQIMNTRKLSSVGLLLGNAGIDPRAAPCAAARAVAWPSSRQRFEREAIYVSSV
jgi:hypothetical protein